MNAILGFSEILNGLVDDAQQKAHLNAIAARLFGVGAYCG